MTPDRPTTGQARWWEQAECAGADSNLFDTYDPDEPNDTYTVRLRAALSYCADCPVLDECAADADKYRDTGVRGGRMIPWSSRVPSRRVPPAKREALSELRARYGRPWGERRIVAENAGVAS